MPKAKIIIPDAEAEILSILGKMKGKHEALGDKSPLKDLPWEEWMPLITEALAKGSRKADLNRELEQLNEVLRTNKPAYLEILRRSRDVLGGVHGKQPRKLMDWGFEVDESVKSAKTGDKPAAADKK